MNSRLSEDIDKLFGNDSDVEYEDDFFRVVRVPGRNDDYVAFDPKRNTVAVLGFRGSVGQNGECLVRKEEIPSWNNESKSRPYHYCCIRGGVEDGEDPRFAAKRELKEEAGYEVQSQRFYDLGTMHHSKENVAETHLFGVDLSDEVKFNASGDGSYAEEIASNEWLTMAECCQNHIKDPLIHVSMIRLIGKSMESFNRDS
jgi:8-oxo-dGTP pyrophosphatase MutT (NUDIX family)